MIKQNSRKLGCLILVAMILLASCGNEGNYENGQKEGQEQNREQSQEQNQGQNQEQSPEPPKAERLVKPYDDIRGLFGKVKIYEPGQYNPDDMVTFTFNQETFLQGSEELMEKVMENGKNPGLGVRGLHEKGITGKGVNVAIIDQNLLLNHPEFAGKVAAYYDTGCDTPENTGSMHAPAVTGILVGEHIGVAPGAKVYFAAVPSWNRDSQYYADGLNWIIEQNKGLPEGEKIRAVSVSAAPSGKDSPFTKNQQLWDEAVSAAQKEGILVLDCRIGADTGFIVPGFYDPEHPDDITLTKQGFPNDPDNMDGKFIAAPNSYRTVAEEYEEGSPSYQYNGRAGLSWGIPYVAGVLALGWEVKSDLSNDEIVEILFDTAYVNDRGAKFINPPGFIDKIQSME